jgi:plastocyanin
MNLSSFALRRGALITLILVTSSVLAACGGGSDNGDGGGGGGTATVENGAVEVTAEESLVFNVGTIEATAGEAFTITFVNNDTVPHNISIYTEQGGDELALGDIVEAGQTVTVDVPALDAGEYYFVCDLHPQDMDGTVVVSG